jgi:HlyD family secretion protein
MNPREKLMHRLRNVGGGLAAVLFFLGGYYFLTTRTGAAPDNPAQQPAAGFTVDGTLETDDVDVSSKLPGRLAEMRVSEGDTVRAGQVVAVLEAEEIDAKVDQAEAGVKASQAQWEQGKLAVTLEGSKAAAQVRQAQAGVEAAQAARGMAAQKLAALVRGARPQELTMAQQGLAAAQAAFDTAEKTYNRVHSLADEGVLSQQKSDEADMAYRSASAQLEAGRARLDMVREGARVEEVAAARDQLRQAEAGVTAAQASLEMARAALLMVDIRGKDVEAARQKVAAGQGTLREVNAYKKQTEILSPMAGRVSRRMSRAGEIVAPGYAILTITRTDGFWVDVYIDENEFSGHHVGDSVRVELPALGKSLSGNITEVLPAAGFAVKRATNENDSYDVRSVQVRVALKTNITGLVSGLTARVRF